jgi:Putative peptidoglycan binding domain
VLRGRVRLQLKQARRRVAALAAALTALGAVAIVPAASADTGGAGQGVPAAPATGNTPFDRQGMWIWYVSRSEHGNLAAILTRARRNRIGTVYVKAGDGTGAWSQFDRTLVNTLHRGGLEVCAWQFVYGDHPAAEARVGATAVANGADCLVIDAEGDYEGKYAAAQIYLRRLRAAIGEGFPLSLAGFPYVDYHPAFPYSVFFGPGGASVSQPQMYWKTIGTSVRAVFEHTYLYNRIWGAPIYPLGQTYEAPGNAQLQLFRRFSATYGNLQPSWWDWQETSPQEWHALAVLRGRRPLTRFRQSFTQPVLKLRSRGDMVVWAQEHLLTAGEEIPVNGIFERRTRAAVRGFQEEHGLFVDGQIGTATWRALLEFAPTPVNWAAGSAGRASSSRAGRAATPSAPLSARLPAKGYEIDPSGAAP